MSDLCIESLLARARTRGVSLSEAKLLLMHVSGLSRTELITHTQTLTQHQQTQFDELITRRLQGEPVAYLIGRREFFSLDFLVSPATLIPRPETECLVEKALEVIRAMTQLETVVQRSQPRILDLGTGCGTIAIALAVHIPDAYIVATDNSAAALAIAKQNAQRLLPSSSSLIFKQGNWWQALAEEERFDLVASNPPYIAVDDPHLQQGDLRFEPQLALTDQGNGLSALRNIIYTAPAYLNKGGYLLLEHGYDQAQAVSALLQQAGFIDTFCLHDYADIPRISGGRYIHEPCQAAT